MLLTDRRNILEIWSKVFGDMEKTYLVILGENVSTNRRNRSAILEKNPSVITLEIWRNVVGAVMAISYWSSQWRSMELGNHKWRLNHNGEKWRQFMETKTLFIIKWIVHIWGVSRIETYEVLDVPRVGNIHSVYVT